MQSRLNNARENVFGDLRNECIRHFVYIGTVHSSSDLR